MVHFRYGGISLLTLNSEINAWDWAAGVKAGTVFGENTGVSAATAALENPQIIAKTTIENRTIYSNRMSATLQL